MDQFVAIREQLNRIEGRLEVLARVEERQKNTERTLDKHEAQLDTLSSDVAALKLTAATNGATSSSRWGVLMRVTFGTLAFVGTVSSTVVAALLLKGVS